MIDGRSVRASRLMVTDEMLKALAVVSREPLLPWTGDKTEAEWRHENLELAAVVSTDLRPQAELVTAADLAANVDPIEQRRHEATCALLRRDGGCIDEPGIAGLLLLWRYSGIRCYEANPTDLEPPLRWSRRDASRGAVSPPSPTAEADAIRDRLEEMARAATTAPGRRWQLRTDEDVHHASRLLRQLGTAMLHVTGRGKQTWHTGPTEQAIREAVFSLYREAKTQLLSGEHPSCVEAATGISADDLDRLNRGESLHDVGEDALAEVWNRSVETVREYARNRRRRS